MDIFSKTRILIKLVWILGLINLFLVIFFGWFFWLKKPGPGPERPAQAKELSVILKDELGLSVTQVDQLKKIRADFFSRENMLSDQTRLKRDSMNMLMFSRNADDAQLKALATGISTNEFEMEMLRIEQAKQLRGICSEEQLNKLEKLVKEIRDYLRPADKK